MTRVVFIAVVLLIMEVVLVGAYYIINTKNTEEIIISLTTSPKRIAQMKPVIDSIMDQSLLPDKIVINLPYVFKRDNTTFTTIPEFLTSNSRIHLNTCEDIGPITKILPTVPLATRDDSMIITLDDDIVYPPHCIEDLVSKARQHPDAVITGSAHWPSERGGFQLAEGYCGILYRKKFLLGFPTDEISDFPRACYLGDDLIISNFLAQKKIKIMGVDNIKPHIIVLDYGKESDALHLSHENPNWGGHDYMGCASYLKTKKKYALPFF